MGSRQSDSQVHWLISQLVQYQRDFTPKNYRATDFQMDSNFVYFYYTVYCLGRYGRGGRRGNRIDEGGVGNRIGFLEHVFRTYF